MFCFMAGCSRLMSCFWVIMQPPHWMTMAKLCKSGRGCSPETKVNCSCLPVCFCSQRGILTRPISSPELWCVHDSKTKIWSPSCRLSICGVPLRYSVKAPLCLASRMLKLVSGMLSGTMADTSPNIWLSVMTRAGVGWLAR